MPQVVVRPGESDEYTIPFTHGWERQEEIGRMRRLVIDVDRAEAKAANLTPKRDTVTLEGVDTVRLVDVETGGSTWSLVCYSAEWDANRAGLTPGGDLREADDQTLISALVGEVSTWDTGDIQSFTGPLSFVFSHAHRHEAIRRVEKNVPGEIQFRDFGTVDYIDRIGTDRSASVELSASAGTIEDDIQITDRGRELDGTHIRVLGAHEGEAQLFANLVPQDDPQTYENEVRYSTPRWSDESDTDWDRWSNKDVTDQATIEEEAAALGEELTEELVEATTVVPRSVGLNVGDTVSVVKPDADLDRSMRVHRLTRQAGQRNDTDGDAAVVDKVLLSTRTTLRSDEDDDLRDIQRFNTSFQGSAVWGSISPGRGPVDSGVAYEIPFFYPQVEYEHRVELLLRGLPYRAYSSGAASGGGAFVSSTSGGANDDTTTADGGIFQSSEGGGGFSETETSTSNSDHGISSDDVESNFVFVDSSSWQTVASISPNDTEAAVGSVLAVNSDEQEPVYARIRGPAGVTHWPSSDGVPAASTADTADGTLIAGTGGITITAPEEFSSYDLQVLASGANISALIQAWGTHTHDVTVSRPDHDHIIDVSDHSHSFDWLHDHTVDVPNHTHDPQPGVIEFGSRTPSNVDVIANGTTVASNVASGTFEETVDLTGELNRGQWNTVEVTSDELGHLDGTISILSYRQIGAK